MRKLVVALAVAAAALGVGGTAIAQYGGSAPGISNLSGDPGASNTASGPAGSCQPGQPVNVTLDGEVVGTATANPDGSYSISFTNPAVPGSYLLAVRCA